MAKKAKMTLKEFKRALESTDSTAYLSPSDGSWRTLFVFLSNRLYDMYERAKEDGNEREARWLLRDWETLHDIASRYKSSLDEEDN